jgi:uroporphyrinogen-III synthase
MRVVLTRPGHDAAPWAQALHARGHAVLPLPLIDIAPAPDPAAVQAAWSALERRAAVMFVSANAVQQFFALAPPRRWPASTRAWATGPGTAAALLAAGVPAALVDAPPADAPQFDSEALWARVAAQAGPGRGVLLVRGAGAAGTAAGRDWLATQLEAAGSTVHTVAAYRRRPPAWSPGQREAAAQAARDGSVWLFSSSESVENLLQMLPGVPWAAVRAVATHPRIAQAAQRAGFGVVCLSRPTIEAVVAALESIR